MKTYPLLQLHAVITSFDQVLVNSFDKKPRKFPYNVEMVWNVHPTFLANENKCTIILDRLDRLLKLANTITFLVDKHRNVRTARCTATTIGTELNIIAGGYLTEQPWNLGKHRQRHGSPTCEAHCKRFVDLINFLFYFIHFLVLYCRVFLLGSKLVCRRLCGNVRAGSEDGAHRTVPKSWRREHLRSGSYESVRSCLASERGQFVGS